MVNSIQSYLKSVVPLSAAWNFTRQSFETFFHADTACEWIHSWARRETVRSTWKSHFVQLIRTIPLSLFHKLFFKFWKFFYFFGLLWFTAFISLHSIFNSFIWFQNARGCTYWKREPAESLQEQRKRYWGKETVNFLMYFVHLLRIFWSFSSLRTISLPFC